MSYTYEQIAETANKMGRVKILTKLVIEGIITMEDALEEAEMTREEYSEIYEELVNRRTVLS